MNAQATDDKVVSRQVEMSFANESETFMTEFWFNPADPNLITISCGSKVWDAPRQLFEYTVANSDVVDGKCRIKLGNGSKAAYSYDVNHEDIKTFFNMVNQVDFVTSRPPSSM